MLALLFGGARHTSGISVPRGLKLVEFRNVIVLDERGTTEIDAVFVGNAGVFVIEAKEYNAWIFGAEGDERWTARYIDGSTHQFQNPLRQNFRHVLALVARLRLPKDRFHSLVVFSGGLRAEDTNAGKRACRQLRELCAKLGRNPSYRHRGFKSLRSASGSRIRVIEGGTRETCRAPPCPFFQYNNLSKVRRCVGGTTVHEVNERRSTVSRMPRVSKMHVYEKNRCHLTPARTRTRAQAARTGEAER